MLTLIGEFPPQSILKNDMTSRQRENREHTHWKQAIYHQNHFVELEH